MSVEHDQLEREDTWVDPTRGSLGNFRNGLIVGVFTAIGCGIGWAAVVYYTGFEFGAVAWGIGCIVAVAMLIGARGEQTVPLAFSALVLIVAALLLGKVLTVQWVMDDFSGSPLHAAVYDEMWDEYDFSQATLDWYYSDELSVPPRVRRELRAFDRAVDDRIAAMSDAEREQMLARLTLHAVVAEEMWDDYQFTDHSDVEMDGFDRAVDERIASMSDAERDAKVADAQAQGELTVAMPQMSLTDQLKMSMSPFDVLWFGLALFSGWRICTAPEE